MRGLAARPLRPPARRSARPAASISTGGRSRRAGRSPMATMPTPSRPRASAAPGYGPASFERPRDWRVEHGGMAESEHGLFARSLNWLRGDLRLFMTDALCAVVSTKTLGGCDETVRRRPRAQSAPGPHLPGREGHRGAAGAGRHGGAGAQDRSRSARATRCSGCRCWSSTTAPILTESIAICRYFEELQPSRRCSGSGALGKAHGRDVAAAHGVQSAQRVAAAFRHIHPAMKEWEIPQVPEWGEANKPKAVDFLRTPRPRAGDREFVAGDAYSIADITGLVALDFMKPARIDIPDELHQRAALAPGVEEPAERSRLSVTHRTRRAGRPRPRLPHLPRRAARPRRCRTSRARCWCRRRRRRC